MYSRPLAAAYSALHMLSSRPLPPVKGCACTVNVCGGAGRPVCGNAHSAVSVQAAAAKRRRAMRGLACR